MAGAKSGEYSRFLSFHGRNPDVLNSIANLSNDEVFTPPELANRMLDTLEKAWAESNNGENIWSNPELKFLDPFTKSGVFLREIATRLIKGLESEIPDLQARVDHILTNQAFGIANTHLTSLIARRSLYCSKRANGKHSITRRFKNESGNIWFEKLSHSWVGGRTRQLTMDEKGQEIERFLDGKCQYCGAPRREYDRSDELENYAYGILHTDDPKLWLQEIFGANMKFDVIIGNPPYQLSGGSGGTSDSSIYHLFVEQAKKLEPRFLSMVIPSRWMAGGRGLEDFRKAMLTEKKIRELWDYPVSKDVFPGVDVKGGICFFLMDNAYDGSTKYVLTRDVETVVQHGRQMSEFDVFVRSEIAVEILRKVLSKGEVAITNFLTADTPFGLATNFNEYLESAGANTVPLHLIRGGKRLEKHISRSEVTKNVELIDSWKVLAPKAGSDGGQKIPDMVLGRPNLVSSPSACTQSYLAFYFGTEVEARSFETYYRTKFFRFLVSLRKITQDALKSTYSWVPTQEFIRDWSDSSLYEKYELTEDEAAFIESSIRPMEAGIES
jgi:site-specific DNA-methyltransferase (adenine-specific)